MAIDADTVRRIAHLARLELAEDELLRCRGQLGAVLDHIDRLRELPVEGVDTHLQGGELAGVLRPDEPRPGLSPEQALANAPDRVGTLFVVPRIIEQP